MLWAAQDEIPARCACRGRIQRSLWRRAAGRRKITRQGTHLFFSRLTRAVGSQEPAPRTLESFQFAHREIRKHSRFSAVELDGARRVALHSCGKHSHRSALDRKSTRLNSSHVEISYAVFCLKK